MGNISIQKLLSNGIKCCYRYELLTSEWPWKHQHPETIVWQAGRGIKPSLANLQANRDVKVMIPLDMDLPPYYLFPLNFEEAAIVGILYIKAPNLPSAMTNHVPIACDGLPLPLNLISSGQVMRPMQVYKSIKFNDRKGTAFRTAINRF